MPVQYPVLRNKWRKQLMILREETRLLQKKFHTAIQGA